MLSDRQEKLLHELVKAYINLAEPISSDFLKKTSKLDVSPATIRNDLQQLAEEGYINQPHTSAGRVPTQKGYRYFVTITFSEPALELPHFISREISEARHKIKQELRLAEELVQSLRDLAAMLDTAEQQADHDAISHILAVLGPSRTTYKKNISLLDELLEELRKF